MGDVNSDDEIELPDLIMPLVVCKSSGGPFDDDSFVAGTYFGAATSALDNDEIWEGYVPTLILAQLDLLAMARKASLCVEDTDDSGFWTYIELHPDLEEDVDLLFQ